MIELIFWQLYVISSVVIVFVMIKLLLAYRLRAKTILQSRQLESLPAVSVCIPARNETNAMTSCLERVLASTYPKLEIIVLDDESTDNTPHLIKAFAHAGVRFIPGQTPPEGWLGKNYALEQLLEQASGSYVIFMDVDTQILPDTIGQLVAVMLEKNLSMLSVVPQRPDNWRLSTWFGTLRFLWELVLHRTKKPSAISNLWMIERRKLDDDFQGFYRYKDEVQPEQSIACELAKTDQYALLINTVHLGVSYEKKWSSQIETSRRLLLPRLGHSLLSAVVGAGLIISVLVFQIACVLIVSGGWSQQLFAMIPVVVVGILNLLLYYRLVWTKLWWLSPIVGPYVAWQELIVLISSVIGYLRGTITWKNRPVNRVER